MESFFSVQGSTWRCLCFDCCVDFSNLTTKDCMLRVNVYPPDFIPDDGTLNVTVNCSCGNREV
ncbi:chitin elicitor receptor kinase 1-like, partial [Trifolium medium]|nr:chitin elicitor receptor kinase 1-like [Trifolium medium]